MIALAKNSEIIKSIRDNLKKNNLKETIVDDLFALSIAIDHHNLITQFFFCDDYDYRPEANELKDQLIKAAKECYTISSKTMESLLQKKNSSYMLACVALPTCSLQDLSEKDFILVSDRLELPGNLGTILRTMDAVNCQAILVVDPITKLNNPTLVHSSRGMNLLIPQCETTYEEAQDFLLKNKFTIYLGEPKLGLPYDQIHFSNKKAIVIGSERYGIHDNWYEYPHEKIYIPMFGVMDSLNVGVAASILLYQARNKEEQR